jgi:predicted HicB family RNase H-like nuclease
MTSSLNQLIVGERIMASDGKKNFTLRIEPDLVDEIKAAATKNHWSANTFVLVAVQEKLQRDREKKRERE